MKRYGLTCSVECQWAKLVEHLSSDQACYCFWRRASQHGKFAGAGPAWAAIRAAQSPSALTGAVAVLQPALRSGRSRGLAVPYCVWRHDGPRGAYRPRTAPHCHVGSMRRARDCTSASCALPRCPELSGRALVTPRLSAAM